MILSNLQVIDEKRKFKIGDLVHAINKHGNMVRGGYTAIQQEVEGKITGIWTAYSPSPTNTDSEYPYKVAGHIAGWAEDELIPIENVTTEQDEEAKAYEGLTEAVKHWLEVILPDGLKAKTNMSTEEYRENLYKTIMQTVGEVRDHA